MLAYKQDFLLCCKNYMTLGVDKRGGNTHYAEGKITPIRFTEVTRDTAGMERKITR
jgi:hypothetical protein